MIDYTKLNTILFQRNLNWTMLRSLGISPETLAKMRKNQPVSLKAIEKICIYLQLPIEEVVEIKLEPLEKNHLIDKE